MRLSFYDGRVTVAGTPRSTHVALVTGASRGLGRALAGALSARGWQVIVDARDASALAASVAALPGPGAAVAVSGDIADPEHRRALLEAVEAAGRLDLVVNNASELGPSPQPRLSAYPLEALERVYAVDTFAPLALLQLVLPALERSAGRVVNVSSDAAVEAYEGWGGYGSAKAALEQLTAVLAAEHERLRVYAFDPGDMATDLQQQAFPGEEISDRPSPESVVEPLLALVEGTLPSGRYRAADLAAQAAA